MKITVLGARGEVGRCVVSEAIARGHAVTAVVRNPAQVDQLPQAAASHVGDAGNADEVATLGRAAEVVINATRPRPGHEDEIVATTRGLLDGLARAKTRLIVVGGAATLTVPGTGGKTVLEDPRYLPIEARPVAAASAAQQETCRAETRVDWTYLSPPALLIPGARTGRYRVGTDELLVDAEGRSWISREDLAVAIIDEAEQARRHRERFTVAY